jgi:sulfur carrier protein ThiS
MRHELTYNDINVSKRKILSYTKNALCKNVIVAILSLSVIVVIGSIGQEEIIRAQSDDMSMNPITMHIHPELSLLVKDNSLTVPAQIGIDASLWKNHTLDEFGMQLMPEMNMSAMAPLHTHHSSGTIHVESTVNRNYTLGDFLNVWGLNVDGKTVRMAVNGKPLTDFKDHVLKDGEQIKLEIQ